MIKHLITALSLLIIVSLGSGCTAVRTFPNAAHPGESVILALGSASDLTMDNINSVMFESASMPGSPIDITANVRSIFRLYGDKVSQVYESPGPGTDQVIRTALHEPWISVMVIDLPEEISLGQVLPDGPATITINTNANVDYPTIGLHINDTSVAIDIIAETNPNDYTANDFEYEFGTNNTQTGNLALLEPRPHIMVKSQYTDDPFTLPNYAAAEIKVDFTGTTVSAVTDQTLKVVVDDMTAYSKSNRNVITRVNNEVLTVILTSMDEKLKPYEVRFAAALQSTNSFTGTPTISSVTFYDQNGTVVNDNTTNISLEVN